MLHFFFFSFVCWETTYVTLPRLCLFGLSLSLSLTLYLTKEEAIIK